MISAKENEVRSIALDRTSNTEIVGFLEVGDRSIIPTGYKDTPQYRLPPVGYANDRTSNTEIVRFFEVSNRSIIPTGYKDTPQYRSIEPQTLELLGFSK